jgi:diguanylate cyclase (GGDEF)-like protein/PAS domain S-box-containing protein
MRKGQTGTAKGLNRQWPGLPPGEDPFRQLVDNVREYAICLMDLDGHVRSWNAGAETIDGYRADEMLGHSFSVLYALADIQRGLPQQLLDTAREQGRAKLEGWRVRKDGSCFWAEAVVTALHDADGETYGFAMITRDLTDQLRQDEELRRTQDRSRRFWNAAISDALTGAYNRRYMFNHLRGELDRREHPVSSLLLFDVDHFKEINDQHGHDAGDQVLKRIAAVARQVSRDSDILFRLGGDEFVLYLPGVGAAGAAIIAQRLRQALAESTLSGGHKVTLSVGVAERKRNDTVEAWIRLADLALYKAKQAGRDRVV